MKKTYQYHEYLINPCHSGFSMFEAGEPGEAFTDENDIIAAFAEAGWDIYELGRDTLPEDIEDISGRIQYPAKHYGFAAHRVFALRDQDGNITYHGIACIEG